MIKLYFENYSGAETEVDIDGNIFTMPKGMSTMHMFEGMNPSGEYFVTWDPSGMMQMDTMDDGDILTADSMGGATFHSVDPAPEEGGTLVPKDLLMSGMGIGIAIAGAVMVILIVKKTLLLTHNYD